MKVTGKGQVTIPREMHKRHGLLPHREIEIFDQADGILTVKAGKPSPGKRAIAAFLRGGRVKARTHDWLRLTRGEA